MSKTLVIAELGSAWRYAKASDPELDLVVAFRAIREAKACGADIAKFQWTSNSYQMAVRRGLGQDAANMYGKYLQFPPAWLAKLKAMCDDASIEFMCTVYLPQDIPVIAPLVKRFKVSAFEATWGEFVEKHYAIDKPVLVSINPEAQFESTPRRVRHQSYFLHCISAYPTPPENALLHKLRDYYLEDDGKPYMWYHGFSDHTTSTLTGAMAVAAGCQVIEKHVRLWDTPQDNPDYGHSLILDSDGEEMSFAEYVRNVREAERCM